MSDAKSLWVVFVDLIYKDLYIEAKKIARLMRDSSGIDRDPITGKFPLLNVIAWGRHEAAEILLENGANINFKLVGGETALSTLIDEEMPEEKNIIFLNMFVKYKIDFELKGYNRWTALHLASARGCIDVVEFLVNHGANINAQDDIDDYETPLQVAIFFKNYEIAKFLIDQGADPYVINSDGLNLMQRHSFTTLDELKSYIDLLIQHGDKV